jgi:hypothetical protein
MPVKAVPAPLGAFGRDAETENRNFVRGPGTMCPGSESQRKAFENTRTS